MDDRAERPQPSRAGAGAPEDTGTEDTGAATRAEHDEPTVESAVRAHLAALLGGPRGGLEAALPIALFALAYVVMDGLRPAVVLGAGSALLLLAVRLVQRSSTQFVRNGLVGIAIAAAVAMATGRAETAFLPGIIQSAAWAAGLGASVLVRWPAAGFLIGGVIGNATGWRDDPSIVRLSNRLTLVVMVPMVVRVAVQYPLYLAGEVGWLGVTRIALGWPLSLAAFAVIAAILARGQTPLRTSRRQGTEPSASDQ